MSMSRPTPEADADANTRCLRPSASPANLTGNLLSLPSIVPDYSASRARLSSCLLLGSSAFATLASARSGIGIVNERIEFGELLQSLRFADFDVGAIDHDIVFGKRREAA